jgi:hypothetical protein
MNSHRLIVAMVNVIVVVTIVAAEKRVNSLVPEMDCFSSSSAFHQDKAHQIDYK